MTGHFSITCIRQTIELSFTYMLSFLFLFQGSHIQTHKDYFNIPYIIYNCLRGTFSIDFTSYILTETVKFIFKRFNLCYLFFFILRCFAELTDYLLKSITWEIKTLGWKNGDQKGKKIDSEHECSKESYSIF